MAVAEVYLICKLHLKPRLKLKLWDSVNVAYTRFRPQGGLHLFRQCKPAGTLASYHPEHFYAGARSPDRCTV